jgi:hypothetical protein
VCKAGGTCSNAVFNFIGANIDGSSALLQGPGNLTNQLFAMYNPGLGTPNEIKNLIDNLGTKALDPNSIIGDRYNGPSIWGNYNGAGDILDKTQKK